MKIPEHIFAEEAAGVTHVCFSGIGQNISSQTTQGNDCAGQNLQQEPVTAQGWEK